MVETEQTTPAPDVESALATIDWEIEQARAAETRPGWTPWVLVAALAAIAWTLLSQPSLFRIDVTRVSLQYVTICGVNGVVQTLRGGLRPRALPRRTNRFSLNPAFEGRFAALYTIAQTSVISWILWSNRVLLPLPHAPLAATLASVLFAAFALMVALVLATSSFVQLPVPLHGESGKPASFLYALAATGLAAYAGGGWVLHDLLVNGDAALAAMKVAGLIAAADWIVAQIIKDPGSAALNERLIALRRDLAYKRTSANEALSQADIAVDGLRLADVFQEDLAGLLKLAEEYTQLAHTAEVSLVATVRAKEVAEATHPPDETAVATHAACLATASKLSTDLQKKVGAIRVRVASFKRRLALAAKSSDSAADADALLAKLAETVLDPIDKAAGNLSTRVGALSEVVKPKLLGASGQVPASVTVLAKSDPSQNEAVAMETRGALEPREVPQVAADTGRIDDDHAG